jgi:hypothetical protein
MNARQFGVPSPKCRTVRSALQRAPFTERSGESIVVHLDPVGANRRSGARSQVVGLSGMGL